MTDREKDWTEKEGLRDLRRRYQITEYCHRTVRPFIREGDLCIDATMGNGADTEFLCRAVGERGHVLAFDIQEEALRRTRERLEGCLTGENYRLIEDSHEHMGAYADPESAACIMFNLGYLPCGDHSLATRPESTVPALETALDLLRPGGILSICIYSGGDSGYEEKEAVLSWLRQLDGRRYLALLTEYANRPGDPPLPAAVIRLSR